jgi:hypothetical protein
VDQAATLTERLAGCQGGPVTAALVARSRAALASVRGDTSTATDELTSAVRWHDQVSPMPAERGRTLLALGALQRRLKQRAAARGTLTAAIKLFDAAGARPWAERAQAEQARVSGRAPGPRDLTETEQRVASLVAARAADLRAADVTAAWAHRSPRGVRPRRYAGGRLRWRSVCGRWWR